ncbi:TM0106 family RecB-like putative nuclease [Hoyosella sp. G463]|uniref:TM0106 family RecB-like putative nuclease n=1 Tax=Lolliginicoccus lacisalsi TaxID=2742202 RepID=A0A927JCU9_9ACTN|nr:TM0106 family RecB-like putative nuclease [Lolliginicoccus lacisalsi]
MNPQSGVRVLLDASVVSRCRHRVHLDATAAGAGMSELARRPIPAGAVQRREAAALHRRTVREMMAAHHHEGWIAIDPDQAMRERANDTLAACAEGFQWIWGAVLPVDENGRRGGAELLVRDPGGTGYIPVIVVNHKVTDPGSGAMTSPVTRFDPRPDQRRRIRSQPRDQFRLAHLYRILESVGLAAPRAIGGVIGYDADCILAHDLGRETPAYGRSVLAEYDFRLADRRDIVAGRARTSPDRVGECKMCEWWPHCKTRLEESHDVSLVVNGAQADMLREAGLPTIDALASTSASAPAAWHGVPFGHVQAFARAWLHDVPLIRMVEWPQVRRADIEVDIDMESYQDHGAYLWGTLLTERDSEPQYRPFVTWDPLPTREEGRNFAEFWEWLTSIRRDAAQRGLTFAAYCYSKNAENRWLIESAQRFRGMNDMPSVAEVTRFINSEEWVDMLDAVQEQFLCPHGRGLKKVAPVAGFSWHDPDAGGEASMSWYRDAVGYEGGPPVPDQQQRLLRYNEDDVWATRVLREWMDSPRVLEVPTEEELDTRYRAELDDEARD